MKVILIVAVCESNLAIGKNNQLLWHLPADMKFFKDVTTGFPIITGRKNYESIPEKFRPLPGRENIVVTRDASYHAEGAIVCGGINEAIQVAKSKSATKCFVIGGGQIYEQCLVADLVDELLITWVDATIQGDTFFKGFNQQDWDAEILEIKQKDAKNPFDFKIVKYTRKLAA